MLKKFLLPVSAAAVLSLVACDDSSSASDKKDSDSSSKITCEVKENSTDAFKMVISIPDSGTVSTEIKSTKDAFEFITSYEFSKNVSDKEIKNMCEEFKDEDEAEISVTCKDRTVSITEKGDKEFAGMIPLMAEEYEAKCKEIQKTGKLPVFDDDDEDDDDEPESSSSSKNDKSSSSTALDPSKVGCEITKNTSDMFAMTLVIPDSAVANYEVSYGSKNPYYSTTATFDKSISDKEIKEFCNEVKSDEDADEYEITCKDRTVSIKAEVDSLSAAFLPLLSLTLAEACREVQETGKIPEDLDLGFGNSDDDDDWTDEEEDDEIESSSSEDEDEIESSSSEEEEEIDSSSSEEEEEENDDMCLVDMDSNMWTVKSNGTLMYYEFDGDYLNYTTFTHEDMGSEDLCELFAQDFDEEEGMRAYCDGSYLTLETQTNQDGVNKQELYESVTKEFCADL